LFVPVHSVTAIWCGLRVEFETDIRDGPRGTGLLFTAT
jgi:hypothetical protein